MAKLLQLFPESVTVYHTDPDVRNYFELVELIENLGMRGNTHANRLVTLEFEEELGKLDILVVVKDFLKSMLVVDCARLSAREVLKVERV